MKTTAKEFFNKLLEYKNIDGCCRDDRYILNFGIVYLINGRYYEACQDEYEYYFLYNESYNRHDHVTYYLEPDEEVEIKDGEVIASDFTFRVFTFLDVGKLF